MQAIRSPSHPLVQAYKDHTVCVINSFRSELAQKKAMFALLTDETLTTKFPAAERKAIRDYVPWTRLVKPGRTMYNDSQIDLIEFILQNRDRLVLKPNDDISDEPDFPAGWENDPGPSGSRAVGRAQRSPYVIRERVEPVRVGVPAVQLRAPGI